MCTRFSPFYTLVGEILVVIFLGGYTRVSGFRIGAGSDSDVNDVQTRADGDASASGYGGSFGVCSCRARGNSTNTQFLEVS